MVDAQSITIATAATEQVGNEGIIFRFVAWHSVALCSIVGVIVLLYGRSSRCQSTPIILVVSWETRGRFRKMRKMSEMSTSAPSQKQSSVQRVL